MIHVDARLRAPSEFRNYAEYMGGLGDVILRLNTSNWYASLDDLAPGEEAAVVLMCHNPGAAELWKWHKKESQIHVFDFGFTTPFHPWENREWRLEHRLPESSPCPPPSDGRPLRFYPSPEDLALLEDLSSKGPYAVFAPVAGTEERTFPQGHQKSILDKLRERGLRPVFVGRSKYGKPHGFPEAVDLIDRLSVSGTIQAVRGASIVVSAHSAVLHMAWFEKKPVFLLYPKWVEDVFRKHGAAGYFFGAEFPTTDHMEFSSYSDKRLDQLLDLLYKGTPCVST